MVEVEEMEEDPVVTGDGQPAVPAGTAPQDDPEVIETGIAEGSIQAKKSAYEPRDRKSNYWAETATEWIYWKVVPTKNKI